MKPEPTKMHYGLWKRLSDAASYASAGLTKQRQLGVGMTVALVPLARRLYGGNAEAMGKMLQRQNGFVGCHPDLMPVALGAVAKAELEVKDHGLLPQRARDLREWCSTALQVYGWQLFRDGWRPLVYVIGLIIGLFTYHSSNLTRALAILAFLMIYNIPVWVFRLWSVRFGWEHGTDLPLKFMALPWSKVVWSMRWIGAGLVGAAFVLTAREWGRIVYSLAASGAEELAWISVAVGFLLGYLLHPRIRLLSLLGLVIAVVLGMTWLL